MSAKSWTKHFDRIASLYDQVPSGEVCRRASGSALEEREIIAREIGPNQPPREILDLGSGPGPIMLEAARNGHSGTLVDLSTRSLAYAQQRAQHFGVSDKLTFHAGDALSVTSNSQFDLILCLGPLYHAPDIKYARELIALVKKVLKRPGHCYWGCVDAELLAALPEVQWPGQWHGPDHQWIIAELGASDHQLWRWPPSPICLLDTVLS